MEDKIYGVSEFNRIVKNFIDDVPEFHNFFLKGELSGVTYYKSGHLYFTIKDRKSQIKCAAFSYKLKRIPEDLKEGDSVTIFGDVGFYEVRGDFQILVRHIEKENSMGELYRKLEMVKEKMEEEGYFSAENKKPLPKYPRNIGVVTSSNGAGLYDIITTSRKRMDNINIYVYPAKVQGDGAIEEIIEGIKTLDKIPEIDLIIAGRGGGSIEDLWAFNEEKVAMAFYNCKKPIISAVGHEIDFLLTDLVADVRAATPTQSAEIAIPVKKDVLDMLEDDKKYLTSLIKKKIEHSKIHLENRENSYALKNFSRVFKDSKEILDSKEVELERAMKLLLERKKQKIQVQAEKIISLNPLNILSRGYSLVKSNEKIIKSSDEVNQGDEIEIKLYKGSLVGTVKEIKN
ncbi:exodeoxyribonuclease VII large subunit [uncultured Fusobacterium sp.]|uniref:exodeoxyribonuclease VII large subunit n=1 Tax=uncultured Fusobacterium sp. TaxID=159267 RepID=UPI0015A5C694|nr:exodeoxyribonuclease VII large subunit [uncultured Fusobacterium sp.]